MAEIVAHMREKRHLGSDALDVDGFCKRHVRRVRSVPERIDDQYIDSSCRFFRVLGHFFAIGKIRQNLRPRGEKPDRSSLFAREANRKGQSPSRRAEMAHQ